MTHHDASPIPGNSENSSAQTAPSRGQLTPTCALRARSGDGRVSRLQLATR
jgi:hypothetical protein